MVLLISSLRALIIIGTYADCGVGCTNDVSSSAWCVFGIEHDLGRVPHLLHLTVSEGELGDRHRLFPWQWALMRNQIDLIGHVLRAILKITPLGADLYRAEKILGHSRASQLVLQIDGLLGSLRG